ncbi:kinase-like domain-containing protein [Cantharellus anzutake]|uniref:kinase-like domain-containing protein n=1 Tax=Cantharellus anzutake TaxID=1750568 RepID=UPI001902FE76|nr:kinase-like domain-containing protein [Cantharellus anzutake]KAF8325581.1 kinase-like domain-containing protein [Cantharellus anzutake]
MLREVKIWASLRHPNVVTFHGWILEFFQEDTTCAKLISAWCERGNVSEYLKRTPDADRRRLVVDISEGLAYLHLQNVIHGDIKPENIVVRGGCAMLCDFGLSCMLLDFSTYREESSAADGSLRFTFPELLGDHVQNHDRKSDVWAFGCASGQVLSGIRPYAAVLGDLQVLRAVQSGEPPYVWKESDEFFANLERCLKQDPEERATIEQVVQSFRWDYLNSVGR